MTKTRPSTILARRMPEHDGSTVAVSFVDIISMSVEDLASLLEEKDPECNALSRAGHHANEDVTAFCPTAVPTLVERTGDHPVFATDASPEACLEALEAFLAYARPRRGDHWAQEFIVNAYDGKSTRGPVLKIGTEEPKKSMVYGPGIGRYPASHGAVLPIFHPRGKLEDPVVVDLHTVTLTKLNRKYGRSDPQSIPLKDAAWISEGDRPVLPMPSRPLSAAQTIMFWRRVNLHALTVKKDGARPPEEKGSRKRKASGSKRKAKRKKP